MSKREFTAFVLGLSLVGLLFWLPADHVDARSSLTLSYPAGWFGDDEGNTVFEATCAAAGTALTDADGNTQNPTAGTYWLTARTDDVFLCSESACASPDGVHFPAGVATFYRVSATEAAAFACRSTSGNGVVRLSKLETTD